MKKKVMIFLLITLFVLGYSIEDSAEKVYMKIVKGPDPSFLGLRYTYNRMQLPIKVEEWVIAYGPRYWKGKFYYYKDNKYVGYNTNKYDTVLLVTDTYDYVFKFDSKGKLILRGGVTNSLNRLDKKNIDFNSLRINVDSGVLLYNEAGYPASMYSRYTDYMTFFDIFSDIKCRYEYREQKTYDGKNQINRMYVGSNIYNFDYDKYGRIIKIYRPNRLVEKEFLFLYYIYRENMLYVIRKWVASNEEQNLELYYRSFNEYGYLECRNEWGMEFNHERYKNFYDNFNDEKKLLTLLNDFIDSNLQGKRFCGLFKNYKYVKVDAKYKDNLKIQEGLLDKYDLTEYYLGITSWYRYKYLHDLTTDD